MAAEYGVKDLESLQTYCNDHAVAALEDYVKLYSLACGNKIFLRP